MYKCDFEQSLNTIHKVSYIASPKDKSSFEPGGWGKLWMTPYMYEIVFKHPSVLDRTTAKDMKAAPRSVDLKL